MKHIAPCITCDWTYTTPGILPMGLYGIISIDAFLVNTTDSAITISSEVEGHRIQDRIWGGGVV